MKKMSCETRKEYISVQKRRYRWAGKAYKTRLLDEVCTVCGYERKHAIKKIHFVASELVGICFVVHSKQSGE